MASMLESVTPLCCRYAIVESQTETGNPYMLYKDACNKKSNQKNLGVIKCSNLCTEIVEYTAPDEVRLGGVVQLVQNLSSMCVLMFIGQKSTFLCWNFMARDFFSDVLQIHQDILNRTIQHASADTLPVILFKLLITLCSKASHSFVLYFL